MCPWWSVRRRQEMLGGTGPEWIVEIVHSCGMTFFPSLYAPSRLFDPLISYDTDEDYLRLRGGGGDTGEKLAATMHRVRSLLRERFLDPASGRLFDYVNPKTFKLSPDMLPTAEEVRGEVPKRDVRGTPIENGPISGGTLLGALVDRIGSPAPRIGSWCWPLPTG